MNFGGLMFVLERKESDCIIIEKPLNAIIADINERDKGETAIDKRFAPFVISIMPDITL